MALCCQGGRASMHGIETVAKHYGLAVPSTNGHARPGAGKFSIDARAGSQLSIRDVTQASAGSRRQAFRFRTGSLASAGEACRLFRRADGV